MSIPIRMLIENLSQLIRWKKEHHIIISTFCADFNKNNENIFQKFL